MYPENPALYRDFSGFHPEIAFPVRGFTLTFAPKWLTHDNGTGKSDHQKMTLHGLKHFYMAGKWLFPGGGLPPAAQSGKWAVQMICKQNKQPFITK